MAKVTNEHESSLPGVLGTIDSLISRLESFALAAGVLLMAANTVANVVGRYIFQYSFFFTEELNRIIIILITFAGVGFAARHGRHIRMSAIFDARPFGMRKALMIIIAVVTAVAMFALCYFSGCTRRAGCFRHCRYRCGRSTYGRRSVSSSPAPNMR